MNRMRYTRTLILAATLAIAFTCFCSCDDEGIVDDTDTALHVIKVSGDNQTERVGAALPEELVVKVSGIGSAVIQGIEVRFSTNDPNASVSPGTAVTNSEGTASCVFELGLLPGEQHVQAAIDSDSTLFTAIAQDVGCTEETTTSACDWPGGRIFITTTSSDYITGTGSVLLWFDPETGSDDRLFVTDSILVDVAFSRRGDLYVSTASGIYKVDYTSRQMVLFGGFPRSWPAEIEMNAGGILVGMGDDAIFSVWCPPGAVVEEASLAWSAINTENLAAHPVTRDLFFIDGASPTYRLFTSSWDGRSSITAPLPTDAIINNASAQPKGMCIDSTGTVYISFNSVSGNFRRIVSIDAEGTVDDDFFDFHAHAGGNDTEAGQWGDITILGDKLYLIDKRNDRLVEISTAGVWTDDWETDSFSMPYIENERYGIAASPVFPSCQ